MVGDRLAETVLGVSWLDSLDEVAEGRWNALAGTAGFYSSHMWLRGYEADPNSEPSYLAVSDAEGWLRAAVPTYSVTHETNPRYRLGELGVPPVGGCRPRVLGPRRGYRAGVLLAPDLTGSERQQVLSVVGSALADVGDCSPVWFYVPDELLPDVLECAADPVTIRIDEDASIAVPEGGFEEYAARLPTHKRGHVRAERRRFLRAGYDVTVEPLGGIAEEAAPLLAQLEWKYGSTNPLEHYVQYVHRLASATDPGVALTCRHGGRLVAFCHCYLFGDTVWLRIGGFDYPHLNNAYEYFNMAFFELIDLAARHRCHRLHLGMGSLEAKINHGATVEDLWLVVADRQRSPIHA